MRKPRGFQSVDAADGIAEDACGTGALQAGKEAAVAEQRPSYSH